MRGLIHINAGPRPAIILRCGSSAVQSDYYIGVRRRSLNTEFPKTDKEDKLAHTPHELPEEFPQQVEQMAALRQSDKHFTNLADSYHTVNRAIHRAETDVEPTSDDNMQKMRRERMALKDQIAAYLREKA